MLGKLVRPHWACALVNSQSVIYLLTWGGGRQGEAGFSQLSLLKVAVFPLSPTDRMNMLLAF